MVGAFHSKNVAVLATPRNLRIPMVQKKSVPRPTDLLCTDQDGVVGLTERRTELSVLQLAGHCGGST